MLTPAAPCSVLAGVVKWPGILGLNSAMTGSDGAVRGARVGTVRPWGTVGVGPTCGAASTSLLRLRSGGAGGAGMFSGPTGLIPSPTNFIVGKSSCGTHIVAGAYKNL